MNVLPLFPRSPSASGPRRWARRPSGADGPFRSNEGPAVMTGGELDARLDARELAPRLRATSTEAFIRPEHLP